MNLLLERALNATGDVYAAGYSTSRDLYVSRGNEP
jgi:hypothetical protein